MLRLFVLFLLFIAILMLLYGFWRKNLAKDPKSNLTIFHPALRYYIILLCALSILGFLGFMMIKRDQSPTKRYHPPEFKNGQVVPGYFE